MKRSIVGLSALVFLVGVGHVEAAVSFGPVPYLSTADIPAGFYAGGSPTALEDFEDGTLDFGITVSGGYLTSTKFPPSVIDSVDADDGVIDGHGNNGDTWFFTPGSTGVTFTFPAAVTAAGMVWTDGDGMTTFEAFGPGGVSLGIIGPVTIATPNTYTGETDSDRFFGFQDLGGITAIKLSNTVGGIEVDHVQYGNAAGAPSPGVIPEPATIVIWSLLGLTFAGAYRWRRRHGTKWSKGTAEAIREMIDRGQ